MPLDEHPVKQAQRAVMTELLHAYPAHLSVDELVRLVDAGEGDTTDAVHHLHREGVIHRRDDFVWPTRAIVAYEALSLDGVDIAV